MLTFVNWGNPSKGCVRYVYVVHSITGCKRTLCYESRENGQLWFLLHISHMAQLTLRF